MKKIIILITLLLTTVIVSAQDQISALEAFKSYDTGKGQFELPIGTKLTGFLQDTVIHNNLSAYTPGLSQYIFVKVPADFVLQKGQPIAIVVGVHSLPALYVGPVPEYIEPQTPVDKKTDNKKKKN